MVNQLDPDQNYTWYCGNCGAVEHCRGAFMTTGPVHRCIDGVGAGVEVKTE